MAFAARITLTGSTSVSSETAFERLFRAEYRKVAGIAHRILSDAHAAEDVAQDVFVSFHRLHAPDSPFAAKWLYTAAAHAALNVLRGQRRRARREFDDAADARSIAYYDDPLESVESVEQRDAVRRALGRISPKYATVLALRYAGLSYAEVASALGVDSGQVGTMLRRAEAAVKKEFDHDPS